MDAKPSVKCTRKTGPSLRMPTSSVSAGRGHCDGPHTLSTLPANTDGGMVETETSDISDSRHSTDGYNNFFDEPSVGDQNASPRVVGN